MTTPEARIQADQDRVDAMLSEYRVALRASIEAAERWNGALGRYLEEAPGIAGALEVEHGELTSAVARMKLLAGDRAECLTSK